MLSCNPYNIKDGFGHTDNRCFCSYHKHWLEENSVDKDGQSSTLMQFMVKIIIIELVCLLIKIISAAFNRSLDAVHIFWEKKG